MAFNGMSSIPPVSQRSLSITATQFASFATPAITIRYPNVYGGQSQIPFTFTDTASWAPTRVPTTLGGAAATAGIHSINSQASEAGYRTHDYGNGGGGGSSWPTWATAVIAACGGAALILIVVGLCCWRHRRKQKAARKRAAAFAAGGGGYGVGDEGKKRRKMAKHGGGGMYTEKQPVASRNDPRRARSAAAAAAALGGAGAGAAAAAGGRSKSRGRRAGNPYDYPPALTPVGAGSTPDSPSQSQSQIRSRDLAALGIARPVSASPSTRRQREYDLATHPNAYPSDSTAFPQFAVPRERRSREFSGGSDRGLLPPAAGFAYQEGDTRPQAGYQTPPRRSPNTRWGEFDDSPGQNGSPARLLASGGDERGNVQGYGYQDDTPRSSLTMSTRGTGGGAYRWDQDPHLSEHMPDADEVNAALGRAMMVDSASSQGHHDGIGMAYGEPGDGGGGAGWAHDPHSLSAHRYGAGQQAPELRRSTTPTYPPPATSTAATSRAPSRQRDGASARTSTYAPSADGRRHLQRSTTPDYAPAGGLGAPLALGGGGRAAHERSSSGESAGASTREGRNYSRASTYATAEDDAGDDEYGAPRGAYAR
ncbi:hypothetical protein JCM8208_005973 [Rhodotorula glutinis]